MKQAGNKLNYGSIETFGRKKYCTQTELANALNPPKTFQQIQKIEKGVNRVFAHQLVHLCKENQWDINEFMALESSIEAHNS